MVRIKETISGKVVSPKTIEIIDSRSNKLIPGQKVLIYKTTGHNIVSASGKIIGKKEKVLGTGEVKIVGNKLIVDSPRISSAVPATKRKGVVSGRVKLKRSSLTQGRIIRKGVLGGIVLIKPIEE